MATAILEDVATKVLPLTLKERCALPPELEAQSPESVPLLDWRALLSPSRQSCIKLSNVEPCVNKAVAHLAAIKDRLTQCTIEKNRLPHSAILEEAHPDLRKVSRQTESQLVTPKLSLTQRDSSSTFSSGKSHQLIVEGVGTGIPVDKQAKPSRCTKNVSYFHFIKNTHSIYS